MRSGYSVLGHFDGCPGNTRGNEMWTDKGTATWTDHGGTCGQAHGGGPPHKLFQGRNSKKAIA